MVSLVYLHARERAVLAELPAAEAPARREVPVEIHTHAIGRLRLTPAQNDKWKYSKIFQPPKCV
jgi:hypothetical protein